MTYSELHKLFRVWQKRLGLSEWDLIMSLGGCENRWAYMQVHHSTNYQQAIIHVNPWVLGEGDIPEEVLWRDNITDEFIEGCLVHELLHLYTRDFKMIVKYDLEGVVQKDVHEQIENSINRTDEQNVDVLARALVKAFKKK